jgi:hypothetical protein
VGFWGVNRSPRLEFLCRNLRTSRKAVRRCFNLNCLLACSKSLVVYVDGEKMSLSTIVKNSRPAQLAAQLSYPASQVDKSEQAEIVLIEINHFFSHHCALPAIIHSLRRKKNYRFVPYIPLMAWDRHHPTLEFVMSFYEGMGIESSPVKASPNAAQIEDAKTAVLSQFECFKGPIWNLTDFQIDDLPLGVHLVETILQQFKSAELMQDLNTTAYAVGLIARYFWWKNFLSSSLVVYIIASHNCYEFAFPQIAGMKTGIGSYTWHDTYLLYSNDYFPLPLSAYLTSYQATSISTSLKNQNWYLQIERAWQKLSIKEKKSYLSQAHVELEARARGERAGSLKNDPRFVIEARGDSEKLRLSDSQIPNVVLYCHAFSDAPCSLPKKEFQSLCSPLVSTRRILELSKDLPINLFVKTHPKPFPQDDDELTRLLDQHTDVVRLPSNLSPNELREIGIDLIITGWGSICYEAPYAGIPTVAYTEFYPIKMLDFLPTFNLDDPESFVRALNRAIAEGITAEMKRHILEVYSIGNLGSFADLTCSKLNELPREGSSGRYSPHAYVQWAETFSESKFRKTVDALGKFFEKREMVFSLYSIEGGV